MKHLFVASSHLTFYICNRMAELDSLQPDDCVFLLTRNYLPPADLAARYPHLIPTDYNQTGQKAGRVFAGARVDRTWRNIHEFDRLVDAELKGEPFTLYAQVCSNDIFSLLATKRNCVAYHIIEDGLSSYRDYNPQTFTGASYWAYRLLLRPLFPRIFKLKNHFISTESPKYRGCIATSSKCFPLHQEGLRVVGNPFQKLDLGFQPDAILSVDPLFLQTQNRAIVQAIYEALAAFVNQKGYSKIGFKFHPGFYTESQRDNRLFYEQTLRRLIKADMVELDKSVVLENVLCTYRCDFYTDHSSVAIYAKQMGITAYSYAHILERHNLQAEIPRVLADCYTLIP